MSIGLGGEVSFGHLKFENTVGHPNALGDIEITNEWLNI